MARQIPGARRSAGKNQWEDLPRVTVLISVAAGAACFAFYGQRRMGEKLLLVCGILLCVMLMIRSLWGIWLRMRQKRQEAFLPKLTKEFRIRCRFRTMIRYVSMLMFLNVFVMMVFSVKFISSQIADEPEALYPYDYVFLANSQDEAYFEALQQECEAEVLSFPMVRVTTLDATERAGGGLPGHCSTAGTEYRYLREYLPGTEKTGRREAAGSYSG